MLSRCHDQTHRAYPWYGGRGIRVCPRWLEFSAFLADMGERPPETTIDRIDPDGDYEAKNCRWADWKTQCENKR